MDLDKFSSTKEVTLKGTLKIIGKMAGGYFKALMVNSKKESMLTTNSMAKDQLKIIRRPMKALFKTENTTDSEI